MPIKKDFMPVIAPSTLLLRPEIMAVRYRNLLGLVSVSLVLPFAEEAQLSIRGAIVGSQVACVIIFNRI